MVDVELTTTATVPANTTLTITIEEDTNSDGSVDNSAQQSIGDGTNTYTLTGFDGGRLRADISLDQTDDALTAELDSVSATYVAPTAPSGLTVTATGYDTVDLEATDQSTEEDEFRLYRSESAGVTTSDTLADTVATSNEAGTGGTVSLSDTGRDDGTTYYYAATAFDTDTGLESGLSNEVSTTTALHAMTDLAVDAINGDQFDLSALDHADAKAGYRFYRRPDGYANFAYTTRVQTPLTQAVADAMTNGPYTITLTLTPNSEDGTTDWPDYINFPQGGYRIECPQNGVGSINYYVQEASDGTTNQDGSDIQERIGGASMTAGVEATVSFVFDPTVPEYRIYKDGAQVGTYSGDVSGRSAMTTGNFEWNSDTAIDFDIDRFAFHTAAFDAADNQAFADGGLPHSGEVHVLHEWADGSGTTVEDTSGNGSDGSVAAGSLNWTGGGAWTQDNGDLAPEYALDFEGGGDSGGDYVKVPHDASLDTTDISVFARIKMRDGYAPDGDDMVAMTGYRPGFWLEYHHFYVSDGSSQYGAAGDWNWNAGEQATVGGTFDQSAGRVRYYKNGTKKAETTGAGTGDPYADSGVTIGIWEDLTSNAFNGRIDDLMLFNRELSESEMAGLHDGTVPSGLMARWKFDEGSGTTAVDSAGTNDGTITGAEYAAPLKPVTYTTTNLLDGERYVLQARVFSADAGEVIDQ